MRESRRTADVLEFVRSRVDELIADVGDQRVVVERTMRNGSRTYSLMTPLAAAMENLIGELNGTEVVALLIHWGSVPDPTRSI
jgi:hypothetical protein